MTLLQDILCPEIELVQKDLCLDNSKFKYSTPTEFVDELKALDDSQRYPFFFVNSMLVDYDLQSKNDRIINVGEIVIATKTLKEWSSEARDAKSFKPILIPFMERFFERMKFNPKISILKEGKVKLHYFYGKQGLYGSEGNLFNDSVDAIQLLNFQFRLSNNKQCNK
jgi:hypothetical protein